LTAHRKRQLEEKMRLAGLYEDRAMGDQAAAAMGDALGLIG
jgi:hypothetical protein